MNVSVLCRLRHRPFSTAAFDDYLVWVQRPEGLQAVADAEFGPLPAVARVLRDVIEAQPQARYVRPARGALPDTYLLMAQLDQLRTDILQAMAAEPTLAPLLDSPRGAAFTQALEAYLLTPLQGKDVPEKIGLLWETVKAEQAYERAMVPPLQAAVAQQAGLDDAQAAQVQLSVHWQGAPRMTLSLPRHDNAALTAVMQGLRAYAAAHPAQKITLHPRFANGGAVYPPSLDIAGVSLAAVHAALAQENAAMPAFPAMLECQAAGRRR